MPDIEVQITTLVRIALNDLREARKTRDKELIAKAEETLDFYCDRLPRPAPEK